VGERSVLILTGEPSGDRAAAPVAAALRRRHPGLRIRAVGGPALREAGAEIVQDIAELGAMGFAEVVRQIPRLHRLEGRLHSIIDRERPDAVLAVDYPGFNLRIARYARRRGVPVVYYIGPQVWAWGGGRIPRIAEAVDRMLVVFPFEEPLYRDAGLRTDFVGNPLLDSLADAPGREEARTRLGVPAGATVLGLLAGSRVQEVQRILPAMAETAALLRAERPDLVVLASAAASVPRAEYDGVLRASAPGSVVLHDGPAAVIGAAADVLLVTSGTATLEAALLGTPLAVLYRTSAVTWFLGRRLVRIPRISLVNIVAGEDVVEEFLQDEARADRVAPHVAALLDDPERRRALSGRLRALSRKLGEGGVAERVAAVVGEEARL
jgi:lipid-A-disaccharide synthase